MAPKETRMYAGAGAEVAKIVGNSDALDVGAARILGIAKALAAQHVKSSEYVNSLAVKREPGKKGVTDRIVYSDDPQSHLIESGHMDGTRFVDGQHILGRAKGLAEVI